MPSVPAVFPRQKHRPASGPCVAVRRAGLGLAVVPDLAAQDRLRRRASGAGHDDDSPSAPLGARRHQPERRRPRHGPRGARGRPRPHRRPARRSHLRDHARHVRLLPAGAARGPAGHGEDGGVAVLRRQQRVRHLQVLGDPTRPAGGERDAPGQQQHLPERSRGDHVRHAQRSERHRARRHAGRRALGRATHQRAHLQFGLEPGVERSSGPFRSAAGPSRWRSPSSRSATRPGRNRPGDSTRAASTAGRTRRRSSRAFRPRSSLRGLWTSSLAAGVVDLRVPSASRNLDVKPYAVSGLSSDLRATPLVRNDPVRRDRCRRAGTPSRRTSTADFTYNTDFAQVEADEQQVNLTRFSLFFPEKREFFLENAGPLQLRRRGRTGSPGDTPILFYSRRIGLNAARRCPSRRAAGSPAASGRTSFGLLNVESADDPTQRCRGHELHGGPRPARHPAPQQHRRAGDESFALPNGPGSNQAYGVDATFAFFTNLAAPPTGPRPTDAARPERRPAIAPRSTTPPIGTACSSSSWASARASTPRWDSCGVTTSAGRRARCGSVRARRRRPRRPQVRLDRHGRLPREQRRRSAGPRLARRVRRRAPEQRSRLRELRRHLRADSRCRSASSAS